MSQTKLAISDFGFRISDLGTGATDAPSSPSLSASEIRNPKSEIPALEWRAHLARSQPWKAVGAVMSAALAGGAALFVFGNVLLALGACVVIMGSVAEFLFPIHYRLTGQGAEVRFGLSRSFIEWSQVRQCYLFPDGLKLSPLPAPGRLEPFRGVFLRFADNKEEVLEFVRGARDAARH